jgi:hypothetical protein
MKNKKCYNLGGQLDNQQDPQNDILKKILKIGLPIAGTAIGAAAGGVGAPIGGMIGSGIASTFAMGGNLNAMQGLSHEQGGIQVGNSDNEVEAGEYTKDGKVLSKRLGFADKMKKFENRVKPSLRPEDKLTKEVINQKFNKLYNTQESEKMYSSITNMFANGGTFNPPTFNQTLDNNPYIIEGNDEFQKMYQTSLDNIERDQLMKDSKDLKSTALDAYKSNLQENLNSNIDPNLSNPVNNVALPNSNSPQSAMKNTVKPDARFNNKLNPIAPALQALDPLYNIGLGLFNKDYANYQSPNLNRMNPYQSNALITAQMNNQGAASRNAIRNTSNTQGNYLSNSITNQANLNQSIGNSVASNLLNYNQANNSITNQNITGKSNAYNQNLDANEQIRDSRKTALSSGLRSTGNIGSGVIKSNQEYSADNLKNNTVLDVASSLYPNFKLLPKTEQDRIVGLLIKQNISK